MSDLLLLKTVSQLGLGLKERLQFLAQHYISTKLQSLLEEQLCIYNAYIIHQQLEYVYVLHPQNLLCFKLSIHESDKVFVRESEGTSSFLSLWLSAIHSTGGILQIHSCRVYSGTSY